MAIFNPSDAGNGNNSSFKKADAFLNISLDQGDRTPKIGAIPLYSDRVVDRQLIEALKDNPDRAQALASKLILRFNMADGSSSEPLDLSFLQNEAA